MGDADEIAQKARRIVEGAGVLALAIRAHVDVEHTEVDKLEVFGLPVWRRTKGAGLPVLLGVTLPRWIRGPRRDSR